MERTSCCCGEPSTAQNCLRWVQAWNEVKVLRQIFCQGDCNYMDIVAHAADALPESASNRHAANEVIVVDRAADRRSRSISKPERLSGGAWGLGKMVLTSTRRLPRCSTVSHHACPTSCLTSADKLPAAPRGQAMARQRCPVKRSPFKRPFRIQDWCAELPAWNRCTMRSMVEFCQRCLPRQWARSR